MGLGRLEPAAALYEQAVELDKARGDERDVAVGQGNLGTVRMYQGRHDEALAAFAEARRRFEDLDEPQSVATAWHQTGRVYQEAGAYEPAEEAYQQALKIQIQIGAASDQATTLNQLGTLYDSMDRLEQAVAFYRQAADLYVALQDQRHEGTVRNNIADTLLKLGRTDEARDEILRAIECKQPFGHTATIWNAWNILRQIEQAAHTAPATQAAGPQARAAYLSYRRDGGYAQLPSGKICDQIVQDWQQGASLTGLAQELPPLQPDAPPWRRTFQPKLQAVLHGSRDRALADDPALDYAAAAELLLLMEKLENSQQAAQNA